MYKDTRWAKDIIALQEEDGKWGWFHSLSQFYDSSITTEQALRRLKFLGYTIEDECIKKAVSYMDNCLVGNIDIPDRKEKVHDWSIFTSLILATWIRTFTKDNLNANKVAQKWADVISAAFINGEYNHEKYLKAYHDILGLKPNGGRLIDFVNFYPISLLDDCLNKDIELAFIDYILKYEKGIYYIYNKKISLLPKNFESKNTSHYLGAIELLSKYKKGKAKLMFVVDWLEEYRMENGKWDMSHAVNDKIYFPLSDNWRKKETRQADCTKRISNLIDALTL